MLSTFPCPEISDPPTRPLISCLAIVGGALRKKSHIFFEGFPRCAMVSRFYQELKIHTFTTIPLLFPNYHFWLICAYFQIKLKAHRKKQIFLKILRQVCKLWKCVLAPMLLSQPSQSCRNSEIELVEICITMTKRPTRDYSIVGILVGLVLFRGNQGAWK